MAKRKTIEERLAEHDRTYRLLVAQLTEVGYLWNGTIVRQMLTCGKPKCACHRDRDRRHGPYPYWSTKLRGRTVARLLSDDEADLYEQWIRNRRHMEAIQRKMLALSKKAAPLVLKRRRDQSRPEPPD